MDHFYFVVVNLRNLSNLWIASRRDFDPSRRARDKLLKQIDPDFTDSPRGNVYHSDHNYLSRGHREHNEQRTTFFDPSRRARDKLLAQIDTDFLRRVFEAQGPD